MTSKHRTLVLTEALASDAWTASALAEEFGLPVDHVERLLDSAVASMEAVRITYGTTSAYIAGQMRELDPRKARAAAVRARIRALNKEN